MMNKIGKFTSDIKNFVKNEFAMHKTYLDKRMNEIEEKVEDLKTSTVKTADFEKVVYKINEDMSSLKIQIENISSTGNVLNTDILEEVKQTTVKTVDFEMAVDKINENVSALKMQVEGSTVGDLREPSEEIVAKLAKEVEERQMRRCNVIIHGVPEVASAYKKVRINGDKNKVRELINAINMNNRSENHEADEANDMDEVAAESIDQGMLRKANFIDPDSVLFVSRIGSQMSNVAGYNNNDNNDINININENINNNLANASTNNKRLLKVKMVNQRIANLFIQEFIRLKHS